MYVRYAYVRVAQKTLRSFLPGASAVHLTEQNFNKREASSESFVQIFALLYNKAKFISFSTKD